MKQSRTLSITGFLRLVLPLVVGLSACQAGTPASTAAPPDAQATTVAPAPLTASGFLEADSVTLSAEVSAPVRSISLEQGQAVSTGQVVALLDDTLARAQRAQAEAALAAAQAALTQTLAGPRPDAVTAAQADVARAQANWLGALQSVTDTAALVANPPGLAVQLAQADTQVKLAEQAVIQARAASEEAQAARDKVPAGYVQRDILEKKVSIAAANLEAAKYQYDGAVAVQEQLGRMRRFPVELVANWHAAQQQAVVAAAQLAAAQSALALARAQATTEQVAAAQAEIAIAAANLAQFDEQLAHYSIRSPIGGVITGKLVQVGEVARAGAPLLVVTDLSQVKLVVYIPVTRMAGVTVGAVAHVSVGSGLAPAQAIVSKIGTKAEFTPSNVQTKEDRSKLVFAVTLTIPNPEMRLKAGMPANATFEK